MNDYATLPDTEAATLITSRVKQWVKDEESRYAAIGLACDRCDRLLLWRHVPDETGLPCTSFAAWMRTVAPGDQGRSTCYAAWRHVRELRDIPEEDIAHLPQSTFTGMNGLSGGVRKLPDVLAAAKQGKKTLAKHIKENYPDQHWADYEDIRLHVTTDQKAEILEEIAAEVQAGEAATAGEVVFGWAMNARLERQTRAERIAAAQQGRVAHA